MSVETTGKTLCIRDLWGKNKNLSDFLFIFGCTKRDGNQDEVGAKLGEGEEQQGLKNTYREASSTKNRGGCSLLASVRVSNSGSGPIHALGIQNNLVRLNFEYAHRVQLHTVCLITTFVLCAPPPRENA